MARRKKKKPKPTGEASGQASSTMNVGTSLKGLLSKVQLEPDAEEPARRSKGRPGTGRAGKGGAGTGQTGKGRTGTGRAGSTPLRRPSKRSEGGGEPSAEEPQAAGAPDAQADPRPSDELRGEDRIAFFDAIAGVRPLGGKPRRNSRAASPPAAAPRVAPGDEEARARLAALVAGGVRFELDRYEDEVVGARVGTPPSVVRALRRQGVVPEATLDLHGMRADEARREVVRFVRAQHRRGARRVCIVHGKGNHSEAGVGVLGDVAVSALTEGGAAPVVLALATAPSNRGGRGALLVELTR